MKRLARKRGGGGPDALAPLQRDERFEQELASGTRWLNIYGAVRESHTQELLQAVFGVVLG
jgi:hypothetical protein